MAYAEGTTVPVEKSRSEVEKLAVEHGATKFGSYWSEDQAVVTFLINNRMIKLVVPLPTPAQAQDVLKERRQYAYKAPPANNLKDWITRESMRRWRCMLIALKAKFEAIETGIETFDEAFLAHIVTESGKTIYERLTQEPGNKLLSAVPGTGKIIDLDERKRGG
jgi:hypothetical protein